MYNCAMMLTLKVATMTGILCTLINICICKFLYGKLYFW
jgi:ABC-type molybdate transport system permease subunit